MIATPLGKAIFQSRGRPPVFLLRDDFTTDAAAPLTSPRPAEPGPGTLTITDTTNKLSVASGQLVAVAGGGQPNPGIWSGTALVRVTGLALVARVNPVTSGYDVIGFGTVSASASGSVATVYFYGTTLALVEMSPHSVGSYVANTSYQIAVVLRSLGAFIFIKGGVFTNWTMLMVHIISSASSLYAKWHSDNPGCNFKIDTFRVLNLPAPFNSDYGLATQRLAGARAASDTFTHEANCLLEYTEVTLPTVGTTNFNFRIQDASNYWQVSISTVGTIILYEVVAGAPTARATVATVVANGHRVVVIADAAVIQVYSNNILRATYSSASNFQTATAGSLPALGTGGAVSDIISWPRTLTGAAVSSLDQAVA